MQLLPVHVPHLLPSIGAAQRMEQTTAYLWLLRGKFAWSPRYMVAGFGALRWFTPDFSQMTSDSQAKQGAFRFVHTRLRTYGESVAFFGGDTLEGELCHKSFKAVLKHERKVAKATWRHKVVDDFIIKQFPAIVTWGLSFAYTVQLGQSTDLMADSGASLSHDLRYVVSPRCWLRAGASCAGVC